jgi:hypothetical protein
MPYALGSSSSGSNNSFGGFAFFQLPKTPLQQQPLPPTQQQTAQQNLTRQ